MASLDGDVCQNADPGEIRACRGPLGDGREPFISVEKSSWSTFFSSPVTANQSNFVYAPWFDAQNLKLPSKILSALRCFFSSNVKFYKDEAGNSYQEGKLVCAT